MTEFELIRHIAASASRVRSDHMSGIGDDCAEYDMGNGDSLLFTTDILTENRHFSLGDITPEDLAYKSLAVNLSDIAAMGGHPEATLLSLAIPEEIDVNWRLRFLDAYVRESEARDVKLIGGDTCSSGSLLTISVTAIGRCASERIKRRSAATDGDFIYVSGMLGASAAGLRDIESGNTDSTFAKIHHRPRVYLEEGEFLSEFEQVHAMMDVSDGIASDLKHILHASHVGAMVEATNIPSVCDVETAVCGGEDYVLLFTVEWSGAEEMERKYHEKFGEKPYRIGRITSSPEEKITWLRDGTPIYPVWTGYEHF